MAHPRLGNWNVTSGYLYGRIPLRGDSQGTRVSMNGTTHTSSKLTPGFYEVYGMGSSTGGLMVFVKDGVSTATASTKDYCLPVNQSYVMEVEGGINDYVAGITYPGRVGTLCIFKLG